MGEGSKPGGGEISYYNILARRAIAAFPGREGLALSPHNPPGRVLPAEGWLCLSRCAAPQAGEQAVQQGRSWSNQFRNHWVKQVSQCRTSQSLYCTLPLLCGTFRVSQLGLATETLPESL